MTRGTDIARAADVLRAGGLVAFPTETVYGLGADASRDDAVARIFATKGRPRAHPLIVHSSPMAPARSRAGRADILADATRLLAAAWPGPLTVILRRGPRVADAVTGGADTVGLRVPAHAMARALLAAFSGGVAAPSANRFGAVSPTTADHVAADLGADVDYILDGGACDVGVESTIVDLSRGRPARQASPGRAGARGDRGDRRAARGRRPGGARTGRAGQRSPATTRPAPRSSRSTRRRSPRRSRRRAGGSRCSRRARWSRV